MFAAVGPTAPLRKRPSANAHKHKHTDRQAASPGRLEHHLRVLGALAQHLVDLLAASCLRVDACLARWFGGGAVRRRSAHSGCALPLLCTHSLSSNTQTQAQTQTPPFTHRRQPPDATHLLLPDAEVGQLDLGQLEAGAARRRLLRVEDRELREDVLEQRDLLFMGGLSDGHVECCVLCVVCCAVCFVLCVGVGSVAAEGRARRPCARQQLPCPPHRPSTAPPSSCPWAAPRRRRAPGSSR